jgi:hypothetical protein
LGEDFGLITVRRRFPTYELVIDTPLDAAEARARLKQHVAHDGPDPALSGVVTDTGFAVTTRSWVPFFLRRLPVEAVGTIVEHSNRSRIHVRLVSSTPYVVLPLLAIYWILLLVNDRSAGSLLGAACVTFVLIGSLAMDRLHASRQIRQIFESIYQS